MNGQDTPRMVIRALRGQEMKLQAAAMDSSDRRSYIRTKSKSPVAAAFY
jgi:hypothetical protein